MTHFFENLMFAMTDLFHAMPAIIGIALVLGVVIMTLDWWLECRRKARMNRW